jgi:hypothetical protein
VAILKSCVHQCNLWLKVPPKIFLIFSNYSLDASRNCSRIDSLDGQANNDVAWPLVSLQDTICSFTSEQLSQTAAKVLPFAGNTNACIGPQFIVQHFRCVCQNLSVEPFFRRPPFSPRAKADLSSVARRAKVDR